MSYYTYILASERNGTLYIGITNDLERRISEHKSSIIPQSFTAKYHVHSLVYFEEFGSVSEAITREKQLKTWGRTWKIELIEKENPEWKDLFVI